jgi:glycosyltransferase involved in cell wall biosynthesis
MSDLSVIILTLDEAVHIERCIRSVQSCARNVFVVDSGSSDDTAARAARLGANVLHHAWVNHARQANWALDSADVSTRWVMRLDADEYLTPELAAEIGARLDALPEDVAGVYLKRRVHFLGQWIRHGGYYPTWLLRIWRNGAAHYEERWIDEHVKLRTGKTVALEFDLVDDNLKGLTWWTAKHNAYATREAIELLNLRYGFLSKDVIDSRLGGPQEQRRRWLKQALYARLPRGLRAFAYFMYRYFARLGFLDGVAGAHFHVLQGFWYRYLVDAKVFELERSMREQGLDAKTAIRKLWGLDVG